MYCEKCKHLFEGDRCPNCRKSHVRPVQPEDPCFLVEKGAPWNGMLEDVLRQNDIPFLTDGRMGAGLATYAGPRLESSRFYVRFDDLDRANTIVDELFGEKSPLLVAIKFGNLIQLLSRKQTKYRCQINRV